MPRMTVETQSDAVEFDWEPRAIDFAETFGLTRDDVEAIVARPTRVTADPSSATREWPTERCHRGDVTVVVARPPNQRPLIWGVYLRLPIDSGARRSGAGQGAGTQAPSSPRDLRHRIVKAGLRIEGGGRHDRILNEDGKFIASMPLSPSDRHSIPNLWSTLRRKGYEV